jgi:phenylalanyl-tRNA synthetase alpha chain
MSGEGGHTAQELIQSFEALASEFSAEIQSLTAEESLRVVHARYLGKKGRATDLMKFLGKIPQGDRPRVGEAANRARTAVEGAFEERLRALSDLALDEDLKRQIDVTLPGRGGRQGSLHPLTLVRLEIEQIFLGLGFEIRTGPLIETEWNNFDALNTPADHPARDMQDTFFVEGGRILRSHTSPVQIRTMLAGPPPVKIIAPGNVFRRDDDATHTPMFPQCECLHVDKNVSFEDLRATLMLFVQRFFGSSTRIRLRPSYFPFTEPSAEVDASCFLCDGVAPARDHCRLCKATGWVEIGGSGMVHPNVFRAVGYDKFDVTGFAFGMGLSRMAMLKYGVSDLRLFYENDLRFLQRFSTG